MFVYLFVDLRKLFQVVLQKGYFLFLSSTAPCIIRVHLSTLQKTYITEHFVLQHMYHSLSHLFIIYETHASPFSVKGTNKATSSEFEMSTGKQ